MVDSSAHPLHGDNPETFVAAGVTYLDGDLPLLAFLQLGGAREGEAAQAAEGGKGFLRNDSAGPAERAGEVIPFRLVGKKMPGRCRRFGRRSQCRAQEPGGDAFLVGRKKACC